MVRIFDRKLKKETIKNYLFQSFLAALVLYLGLNLPLLGEEIVLVAAAGSTAFIVFGMPSSRTANPRRVIGSHLICGLIGLAFHNMYPSILSAELAVSLALGFAILAMVSLWLEHPPAGGTVLFFVLNPEPVALVSLLLLVSFMTTLSYVLRPYLYDLL
ncbi:MAG: HPP family protein [Candidatus Thermoplasmatota archaeon]|nr:HPP family protein [Candidatus Thermoplasmatota archaeon]MBS3790576.1 HPP family protein [Candidatus Thermoplasmatota archaeon]